MKKNNYFYIAIIGLSGIIGGAINYIYHPTMLQFMTLEDFGIFGSLVGLFNILGILTVGFDLFLNKEFSKNLNDKEKIKSIYIDTLKIFGTIGFLLFLLFSLLSPMIADFLRIENSLLLIMTGVSIIFAFLGFMTNALLKSLKIFIAISIAQILGPIVKLSLGVFLVYLGFNIFGAILGFLLSGLFGLLFLMYFGFRELKDISYKSNVKGLLKNFFENKKELLNFFLISFFFTIFMNIDIILVRNIFSAEDAGIYTGVAVLGKFLIFLLLSVETVYFGQIMEHEQKKIPFHLLKNPLIIMLIMVIGALVFNYFFGAFMLGILKPELVQYINVYLLILVYYGLLAFISFFIKILVGWKKYSVNILLAILTFVMIGSIYCFGQDSLEYFAIILSLFGIVAVIIITIFFTLVYKKGKKINTKILFEEIVDEL